MRYAGVWVGIGIFLFSITFFLEALSYKYYDKYSPGPGLFPTWLSGALIILTIPHIIGSFRKKELKISDLIPSKEGMRYILSIIISIAVFLLLVGFVGYIISSIVMLLILLSLHFKWYWSIGISVIITFLLYFIFQGLLSVPLPVNTLWG